MLNKNIKSFLGNAPRLAAFYSLREHISAFSFTSHAPYKLMKIFQFHSISIFNSISLSLSFAPLVDRLKRRRMKWHGREFLDVTISCCEEESEITGWQVQWVHIPRHTQLRCIFRVVKAREFNWNDFSSIKLTEKELSHFSNRFRHSRLNKYRSRVCV